MAAERLKRDEAKKKSQAILSQMEERGELPQQTADSEAGKNFNNVAGGHKVVLSFIPFRYAKS